ncbi:MAG: sulfotransferase [Salaquimonas sp.]
MNYQPLFIIGAGRSGTNILRDTMTRLKGFDTWDCDEINLIWRHGNIGKRNDIFGREEARAEVARFIRKEFSKFQRKSRAKVIIEKTCANSLRIPFIDEIFPDARYLYIVRDGRDVALSAAKRWRASVELAYLLKKLRYVPIGDLSHYSIRFLKNRLHQIQSQEKRQASWGPIFPDMPEWAASRPLLEVCAKQWAVCVEESDKAFEDMPDEKTFKVHYEALVTDPRSVINLIADWYGPDLFDQLDEKSFSAIHAGSLNGWIKHRQSFTPEVRQILDPVLGKHGYEITA